MAKSEQSGVELHCMLWKRGRTLSGRNLFGHQWIDQMDLRSSYTWEMGNPTGTGLPTWRPVSRSLPDLIAADALQMSTWSKISTSQYQLGIQMILSTLRASTSEVQQSVCRMYSVVSELSKPSAILYETNESDFALPA